MVHHHLDRQQRHAQHRAHDLVQVKAGGRDPNQTEIRRHRKVGPPLQARGGRPGQAPAVGAQHDGPAADDQGAGGQGDEQVVEHDGGVVRVAFQAGQQRAQRRQEGALEGDAQQQHQQRQAQAQERVVAGALHGGHERAGKGVAVVQQVLQALQGLRDGGDGGRHFLFF